jgi:hypothetical protein
MEEETEEEMEEETEREQSEPKENEGPKMSSQAKKMMDALKNSF